MDNYIIKKTDEKTDSNNIHDISYVLLHQFSKIIVILIIVFLIWIILNADIVHNVSIINLPKCFLKTTLRTKNFFSVRKSDCKKLYKTMMTCGI